MKKCSKCNVTKPLTEFSKGSRGYRAHCKECTNAYNKSFCFKPDTSIKNKQCTRCGKVKSTEHFPKHKRCKDGYSIYCKECSRLMTATSKYKITASEYKLMHEGSMCQICGVTNGDFVIDHDHTTGIVRGLLCVSCNSMLGMAKDSVEVLNAGARYLSSRPLDVV